MYKRKMSEEDARPGRNGIGKAAALYKPIAMRLHLSSTDKVAFQAMARKPWLLLRL